MSQEQAMGTILETVRRFNDEIFIRHRDHAYSYAEIAEGIESWVARCPAMGIRPGDVVSVVGDFSPESTVLLLALLENGNIVVPLDAGGEEDISKRQAIAGVSHCFRRSGDDFAHSRMEHARTHPLLEDLRNSASAGIILFTSGTTGESKAAVHSFQKLISKYIKQERRKPLRTLAFLKFDHIGGLNTLFSILMNGGCMTVAEDRSPADICRLIEKDKVELLPTTPSFLGMLILSKAYQDFDLSSLRLIAYGTEPMPQSTLNTLCRLLPDVKLKQTYGLTELGIFATRSRSNESTFMAIREGNAQCKVHNDVLFIKTESAMLGYLNADSPFDEDGWYNTGDKVKVEDGFIKILGRDSEAINVGGEKVYPAEVESLLLEMENVSDVAVGGKGSVISGQIVSAVFVLEEDESVDALRKRVWEHCRGRLESYKIPRLVAISKQHLVSSRFKKNRSVQTDLS
jgi:acyl-CoA synthetase (AMP-forming)/AMP-acid ligase II